MNWPLSFRSHWIWTVMDFLDLALCVADELLGGGEIDARVGAELRGGLFLAVVQAIDLGPFGPGIVRGAVHAAGAGRISSCTRLLQPWRMEVPTQSVPVSPPPMTMTSLPSAEMKLPFLWPSSRLRVLASGNPWRNGCP